MQLLLKPPCGSQIEWPRITNVSNLFNMCLSYALGLHINNHDIKNFPRERIFIGVFRESRGNECRAKCFIICSYIIMSVVTL